MLLWKRKGPYKEYYGCENLGQFNEVIQLPYHPLRSIKETICPFFFQQAARAIGCATKKVQFFLSKINRNFALNKNLVKFLFDQFLTIIVDRDLILKIKNLLLIFHPGHFAQLGIRKNIEPRTKKTAGSFEICFLSKK